MSDLHIHLACVECGKTWDALGLSLRCSCGGTLSVEHDLERLRSRVDLATFDGRLGSRAPLDRSGVWRFRDLIVDLPETSVVTHGEGNTNLYRSARLERYCGVRELRLKHEGENPTASFKDRGMTVAISMARHLGQKAVACASTGNTSASMAAYAAFAGMKAFVFIPRGNVAYGKLCQALAYGAHTIQIDGDFDAAMALVQDLCQAHAIYLVNSLNPYRIEGQKAIGFELLQDLGWEVPDWVVLPGGNLGNSAALYKGLSELKALGLIDRLPRIAVIQAAGANPLYTAFKTGQPLVPVHADTVATAIKIGNPVSTTKSMRGVVETGGVVEQVTDQEIMDAKAHVDAAGIGAEPASCATVAGVRKLVAAGVIDPDARICGVLTGHLLKDPDAVVHYHLGKQEGIVSHFPNAPVSIPATLEAVEAIIAGALED